MWRFPKSWGYKWYAGIYNQLHMIWVCLKMGYSTQLVILIGKWWWRASFFFFLWHLIFRHALLVIEPSKHSEMEPPWTLAMSWDLNKCVSHAAVVGKPPTLNCIYSDILKKWSTWLCCEAAVSCHPNFHLSWACQAEIVPWTRLVVTGMGKIPEGGGAVSAKALLERLARAQSENPGVSENISP